jgi:hypothetical protein
MPHRIEREVQVIPETGEVWVFFLSKSRELEYFDLLSI